MQIFFSLIFLVISFGSAIAEPKWDFLYEEDGIRVYKQDTKIPTFKAEGRLKANLYELLAIMADVERRGEWVANLSEIKIIEGDPETNVLVYNRFDLPWPASDRDSIIKGTVRLEYAKREVNVLFESTSHPSRPAIDGVVRINHLQGFTHIKYVDEQSVDVVQQAAIDPGGNIPLWVAKMFAEDQPINTIKALKKQLERTKGEYEAFVLRHKELAAQQKQRSEPAKTK